MRICARCHRPIKGHEAYETQDRPSASGQGQTLYRHAVWCPDDPPPTEVAPTHRRRYGRAG
ncbi:hypothetical protein ACIP88_12590 [Streptomyces uncialis]|uniref:hypothetical protein n=1 Tax=Streptomyces uncialis TaxID=1048205 RepID=UPI0038075D49